MNPAEWKGITEKLEGMLESLKYGSITLVIQDGKVIQIEKHEKVRIQSNNSR
ncbi:MAG: YezD family protein [Bacillota bacterium]|nr:YezD family protein [Bacillota bacterium]